MIDPLLDATPINQTPFPVKVLYHLFSLVIFYFSPNQSFWPIPQWLAELPDQ
jgi:hypothetical protein